MPDFTVERTFCCVFTALIATAGCSGKPSGGQARPVDNVSLGNGIDPIKGRALEDIYNLLNKTVIQNLIVDHSNITNGSLLTDQLSQLLAFGKPTKEQPTSTVLENRFQQISTTTPASNSGWQSSITKVETSLEYHPQPQQPSDDAVFVSFLLVPAVTAPWYHFQNGIEQQAASNLQPEVSTGIDQRPTFAGNFSGGRPGQLVPPGEPWPAQTQQPLEDRFQGTTAAPNNSIHSQGPSFAGEFSAGRPGQLVPAGQPLPAQAITTEQVLEDRFKETSTTTATTSTNTKSPLEYQPHKPSYAGNFSSGRPGQLVPPGKPWPAQATTQQQTLEDRFKEPTSEFPTVSYTSDTPTSSKLPSNPHGPFFAGEFSSGGPGQLVPPGKPWPAQATTQQTLEDRFKETTSVIPTSSKLPSIPHGPFFAGEFSAGRPGQLVPPGKPWPADPPNATSQLPSLEDRFQETKPTTTTDRAVLSSIPPLEYQPHRPSFAGGFSNGRPGQLVPPGKPWPANP